MHCSKVRHASEGTSENLPLPPGKEFSTFQKLKKKRKKEKEHYSQVIDYMEKNRKERECQSVNLFIHEARKVS